jgi:glyoxylase-like metal-dependent hydrolase (beta-lactamase superfamily II)
MKISDSVYMFDATRWSHSYIVWDEEIILIDTGIPWFGKGLLRELEFIKVRLSDIKHIVLTHYDVDHIGSAAMLQKLTNATVWASKQDIPYIYGVLERHGIRKYVKYLFPNLEKLTNIKPFEDNQKIGKLNIIATPGHTPGHVSILYEDIICRGSCYK